MTLPPLESPAEDGLSFVALGTVILRRRWFIVRWAIALGIVAALSVAFKKPSFRALAAFIPQGQQSATSSLSGLAGQFGFALPAGASTQSPEFYAALLKSRALLVPIVHDTFVVAEEGARRGELLDLLEIEGPTPLHREERAVRALSTMISTTITKQTGVVEVGVISPSRSMSLQLAERLLRGVNEYNEKTRQSTAAAERRVLETSLNTARRELTEAEEALDRFTLGNRQIGFSTSTSRDRLQRTVDQKGMVYTSLAQAYEDARIREVRDTPAIAIFEPAWAPTYPQPRGRVIRVLLGLIAGAVIAIVIVFFQAVADMRRRSGDPEFDALLGTVADVRHELTRPFRRERTAAP